MLACPLGQCSLCVACPHSLAAAGWRKPCEAQPNSAPKFTPTQTSPPLDLQNNVESRDVGMACAVGQAVLGGLCLCVRGRGGA